MRSNSVGKSDNELDSGDFGWKTAKILDIESKKARDNLRFDRVDEMLLEMAGQFNNELCFVNLAWKAAKIGRTKQQQSTFDSDNKRTRQS